VRDAIVSLNIAAMDPSRGGIVALVAGSIDALHWSGWYRMVVWGKPPVVPSVESDAAGRVNVDTLTLSAPARFWRYRLVWNDGGQAAVRRVALNLYRPQGESTDAGDPKRESWGRRLEVPFFSQWQMQEHPGERVCSPTAVAMLGRYFGADITPEQIARSAYDRTHDLYGNWSLNMLAVADRDIAAFVDRGTSVAYLEAQIAAGHPVVASVAYADGELQGAPVPKSNGHLIVVAGFDDEGNPVVRDPAARGEDVWLTYKRDEFSRAWLGHGGIVYRIERTT